MEPWLAEALEYSRATGYFSSSVLSVLHEGYRRLFENGGKARIVTSPVLDASDIEALHNAVYDQTTVLGYWGSVDEALGSGKWRLAMSYLVARGLLTLQFATPAPQRRASGIYHEKFALLSLPGQRTMGLVGSANETAPGWTGNFERLEAYCSWQGAVDQKRVRQLEWDFTELWFNRTLGLQVVPLLDALRRGILRPGQGSGNRPEAPVAWNGGAVSSEAEVLQPPPTLVLWPHQREAIRAWGEAGGRGILEMATGTGKTTTALMLACQVFSRIESGLCIVIVAPLIHLVDQWIREAASFGLSPIRCAESSADWEPTLDSAVYALNAGQQKLLSIVTTAASLDTERFSAAIRRLRIPMLLIGDEVHNYGTKNAATSLPQSAHMRLGLSATPVRWMDSDGTALISGYFGPVVYRYGLERAIADSILTPYYYYPQTVMLEDDEFEKYVALSRSIARYWNEDDTSEPPDPLKRLLFKRARLLASANAKLSALKHLLERDRAATHILVYCGDGTVAGRDSQELERQREAVVRMIGTGLGMRCAPFVAETPATIGSIRGVGC